MKEYKIEKNDAGQRVDKFITKTVPLLPQSLLYKYLRLKRIKLNGKRAEISTRLQEGDVLTLYINDEFFAPKEETYDFLRAGKQLDILYEDENLLLLDKKVGLLSHPDEGEYVDMLIGRVQRYLYEKGEFDPKNEAYFAPALVNRIDRNTGGIVIAAKNAEALRILNEKIRDREIDKRYLCVVRGRPKPPEGRLEGYLFKDAKKNQVYVRERPEPGAKTAVTRYRLLQSANGLSLVECTLLTGRTHQIRAQMAHAGWPLLGDGKYGSERENRRFDETAGQALYSYRLRFDFPTDAGILNYLRGREFTVEHIGFVDKYFPGYVL
jgi:23S rRNA pseudouridine955/2504/2580 synthase